MYFYFNKSQTTIACEAVSIILSICVNNYKLKKLASKDIVNNATNQKTVAFADIYPSPR